MGTTLRKPSFIADDLVGKTTPNDTGISATYRQVQRTFELNAGKNETKATESLATLLYCIDPH
jgi:hypothetical protein